MVCFNGIGSFYPLFARYLDSQFAAHRFRILHGLRIHIDFSFSEGAWAPFPLLSRDTQKKECSAISSAYAKVKGRHVMLQKYWQRIGKGNWRKLLTILIKFSGEKILGLQFSFPTLFPRDVRKKSRKFQVPPYSLRC